MKRFTTAILYFAVLLSALGQGTIMLTNIHHPGQILLNGIPAQAGEASVRLVTMQGDPVGNTAEILGGGKFSAGVMALGGLTGTVSLRLAVTYNILDTPVVYSDPLIVSLGGSGVPPRPAAILPAFNNINYDPAQGPPDPPDPGPTIPTTPQTEERTLNVDKNSASKFYRADELKILTLEEDSMTVSFVGTLEVAESISGPWELVE